MSTSVSSVLKFFPSPQNGFQTTLASTISSGATTVPLNSVAGYANGETGVWVVDPTSATLKQTFTGVVDTAGVQITGVVWTAGTNASHAGGATVVDYATATHISMMTKGIKVNHTDKGNHKTLTDDNANEWVEQGSTASAVNQVKVTNAATGTAPSIAANGDDTNIDLKMTAKGTGKAYTDSVTEWAFDFVVSGLVWTADAAGSTRAASMTAGFAYISGVRVTIAAVTARTFTASKDTYIDLSSSGTITYTEVTNNAASPALSANNVRLGIIVTGAGSIAAAASVNQGQEDRVLPIASSIPYSVTDSLGNLICPRDPQRKLLGYRQRTSGAFSTSSTTAVQVTELACPVIVPTGRKVKVSVVAPGVYINTGVVQIVLGVWDGVVSSGTLLSRVTSNPAGISQPNAITCEAITTPATSSKTYNASLNTSNAADAALIDCGSGFPVFIKVELA